MALAAIGFLALTLLAFEFTTAERIWNSRGAGASSASPRGSRAAASSVAPRAAARRFSEWERVLDILLFLFATAALTLIGWWIAAIFVFAVFAWNVVWREIRLIGAEAMQ